MSAASALLRGRRRAAPLALALGVLAVAGVVAVGLFGSGDGGTRRASSPGGSTATVTRQTLVSRETVDGTLGYAGSRTVINRLSSSASSSPSGGPTGDGSADAATAAVASFHAAEPDGNQPSDDDAQPQDDQPEGDEDLPAEEEDEPEADQPQGDQPQSEQPQSEQPQSEQPESVPPSADSSSPRSSDGSDPNGSDPNAYSGSGTLTATAAAGSVVKRGGALYRLDGDPIVLMYGATPAYRTLEAGVSDGRDVRQLEQNLAALGFDPGTVDDGFDSATAAAVADWQESAGLERTGVVELGRVVFLPGARRVGGHKAAVGNVLGAGSEVLDTSSTKRVVTVELDASLQNLAREGDRVEVTLPDGSPVRGHITDVGRVAREVDGGSDDPSAEQQLVIDVTIELRSKRGIGRLDEAPVGVGLAQESRRDVLAVPVNALLARRGGYGIELAGSHRIVPVEAGLFADGDVEISGRGVREGTRVVVPRE